MPGCGCALAVGVAVPVPCLRRSVTDSVSVCLTILYYCDVIVGVVVVCSNPVTN